MDKTPEELKGELKEGFGKLTEDKDMEHDGKADQVSSKVKEGVDKVKDLFKGDKR